MSLIITLLATRRYTIKKLNMHPRIGTYAESFSKKNWGKEARTFEERTAEMTRVFALECDQVHKTHVGFKWMTNQHQDHEPARMSAWLGETRTKLLFLWRRSLLREYVSQVVLDADPSAAHASSSAKAASTAGVSVTLPIGAALLRALDKILKARATTAAFYEALPSLTIYYEDVVESSKLYNQTWSGVLAFLGVPDLALDVITESLVIHADKPLLASVSNAAAVLQSLRRPCGTSRRSSYGTMCAELALPRSLGAPPTN